jgi:molybdate transport system substrate-binding protein
VAASRTSTVTAMRRRAFVAIAIASIAVVSCRKNEPDTVIVFAAASTADALTEIGAAYQARTGHEVRFSFGGSSELARQIEAGANADVFLSADVGRMDALTKSGNIDAASRRDLLSNSLVVVVPKASSTTIARPADLAALTRIATGDPATVPIGIYAKKWLETSGAWATVGPKIVSTVDVRAALAAVESESVDAAIVYRTDALVSTKVKIAFEVPRAEGPRIVYPVARTSSAREPGASAFLSELTSEGARGVFEKRGFVLP